MGTKNNTAIPEEKSKVCFLRVIFIASLVVAAVVCGAVTYHVVRGLENEVGARTFESVAASLLQAAKARTLRNVQSGELMVTYLSFAFPNASMWPLVALDGYIETAGKAANLLSAISFVLSMIVRPDQATEFERFAARVYKNQGYAEGAGTSDFGFGIWAKDEDSPYPDGKIHDISGNTTYGSEHSILVPVFLHNIRDAESLMYNSHSDIFRGAAIDSMLECAQAASSTSVDPQCDVVTDFVELFSIPGPAALLFQPVYPVNDPTTIVAMVSTSMNWEVVFTNAVPGYVDGLHCVVSTGTKTYTYVVRNGLPRLVGLGDLHDPAFDSHAKSVILNNITTGASASASYTLTVYPTSRMFAAFQTNVPLAISLGFVAIIIFCAALFFLYDFFIRHKSRQRKIILEVKRSFVRFVSHEIRTPLNTVCLGLELLQAEMRTISDKDSSNDARNGNANRVSADADLGKSWLDLTSDIIENSNNAVEILNDLLNYDKIETGTFKLEIGKVHMWELVHKTVSAFDIQAKQREIRLTLTKGKEKCDIADVDVGGAGIPDLTRLHVLGDDVRLRQVIQNLVLNALKFSTDKTGAIDVEVAHEPHGLAKAAVPRMDAFKKSLMNALECDYARAGSILISVRDNGAGMTQEQLGRLFEEGVQFDANKLQVRNYTASYRALVPF
jgi:signal transduction histidine kinase